MGHAPLGYTLMEKETACLFQSPKPISSLLLNGAEIVESPQHCWTPSQHSSLPYITKYFLSQIFVCLMPSISFTERAVSFI